MRFIERFALTLSEVLKVSPAAVSRAVGYLQQVGMVAREREPGERRDRYRVHDAAWYEAVVRWDKMLARWQEDLGVGIEAVGADTRAGRRLEEARQFYEFLHEETPMLMDRWHRRRPGSAEY